MALVGARTHASVVRLFAAAQREVSDLLVKKSAEHVVGRALASYGFGDGGYGQLLAEKTRFLCESMRTDFS